jgi:hypothetical protein
MPNEIIPFGSSSEVPAHLAALFGDSNIAARANTNQLSVRGKVWRLVVDGKETPVMRKNADGDEEAVQSITVVVLDHNKARSRAFYPGAYEEGKNSAPTCYSADGIKPDASVTAPVSPTCAACPNSVKGSKITEAGKQSTLCSVYKRICVVPSGAITPHPPLLVKLPQTSIWDKDGGVNGWFAYDQYMDMLRQKGVKHTGYVETKMKFDVNTAFPKLMFSAARWLSPDEAAAVSEKLKTDAVAIADILSAAADADGVTGTPATTAAGTAVADAAVADTAAADAAAEQALAAAAQQAKDAAKAEKKRKAAEALAAAQAAAAAAEDDDEDAAGAVPATVAAVAATPKATPKATPATATAATAATAATVAPVVVAAGTPESLKNLLDGWSGDD